MKRLCITICALCAVAFSYAPLIDRPGDAKFHGELSDSQMNQVQGQASGTVLGSDDLSNATGKQPGSLTTDSKASNVVGSLGGQENAVKSLKNVSAEEAAKQGPNFGRILLFGTMFLAIGGGIAYGVRLYLDKSVPEAPVGRSKRN